MEAFKYDIFETPSGWVGVLASPAGVRRCALKPTPDQAFAELYPEVETARQDEAALAPVRERLLAYMCGEGVSLDGVPLDMEGATPFFRRAWEACRRIPPGETRSYKWLAEQAGRPNAPRAAGQAMARNRFCLFVPCHRVIASDGSLGGYGGGGLGVKKRLLEMERALVAGASVGRL
jgi:O-6-methylguanine DNA methyltransferase